MEFKYAAETAKLTEDAILYGFAKEQIEFLKSMGDTALDDSKEFAIELAKHLTTSGISREGKRYLIAEIKKSRLLKEMFQNFVTDLPNFILK